MAEGKLMSVSWDIGTVDALCKMMGRSAPDNQLVKWVTNYRPGHKGEFAVDITDRGFAVLPAEDLNILTLVTCK